MKRFRARGIGEVELTDERRRHILERHPEIKPHLRLIPKVLSDPEVIRKSRYDSQVLLFYRRANRKLHLAVVVKTNMRSFVITVYLTDRIARS